MRSGVITSSLPLFPSHTSKWKLEPIETMCESGWSQFWSCKRELGSVLVWTGSLRKSTEVGSLEDLGSGPGTVFPPRPVRLCGPALWPWPSSQAWVPYICPPCAYEWAGGKHVRGEALALSVFPGDQFCSQFRKDWALPGGHSCPACYPSWLLRASKPPALPPGMANPAQTPPQPLQVSPFFFSLGLGEMLLPKKFHNFYFRTQSPGWRDEPRPASLLAER